MKRKIKDVNAPNRLTKEQLAWELRFSELCGCYQHA